MKYHYTKPTEYSSMYGQLYECNHPAYNHCTLYLIGDKGLAVIQQRYDKKSKCTWWSEIDRCLTDSTQIIIVGITENVLLEIFRYARLLIRCISI